ncbi:MAG: hypothetical protein ACJA2Q_001769 [Pseudohongiellaceae bacterium]|jgi:hypothetical protein
MALALIIPKYELGCFCRLVFYANVEYSDSVKLSDFSDI